MAYIDSGGGAGKGGGGGGFDLSSLGNIGGLLGAGGGLLAGLLGGGNNVPYSANLQGIVGQIGQVGAGAAGESSILSGEGNQAEPFARIGGGLAGGTLAGVGAAETQAVRLSRALPSKLNIKADATAAYDAIAAAKLQATQHSVATTVTVLEG